MTRDGPARPRRLRVGHLLLAMIPVALVAALAAAVDRGKTAARESQCHGDMYFLGFVLRCYRDRTGHFPPAVTPGPDGQPMPSWRAIAFAETVSGFRGAYDVARPWDSPSNLKAADPFARNLACRNTQGDSCRFTNFVAVVFPDGTTTLGRADPGPGAVHDNPGRILFIEDPGSTIPWTEPRDLDFKALDALGPGHDPHGLGAVFADGSFRRMPRDELVAILRRQWSSP